MTAPHSAASPTGSSTVAGILILAALTLFFEVDIGFAAITIGLVLMLIAPQLQKGAIGQISWPGEMPCEAGVRFASRTHSFCLVPAGDVHQLAATVGEMPSDSAGIARLIGNDRVTSRCC